MHVVSGDESPGAPSRRWKVRQVVYGEVLDSLDRIFSGWAIEYMPIKGAHLICTGLAGRIEAREMDDIDLLVRPSDFLRAIELFSSHPLFTREPPDPWHFEQSFLYRYGNHPIHFELHRALNRPERFTLESDALFNRSHRQTAARRVMSAEDALVVLIAHTLVHLVDGIREQVYDEAALLLQEPKFTFKQFSALLDATGIGRFGRALLTITARRKGAPLPVLFLAPAWAVALLAVRTPRRYRGIATALYRGFVETVFVKKPASLLIGYARRKFRSPRRN
ncbi:MAG: nucleotidyltransferase family protein [Chitinispirillaceae bacterium]|nr:nucleotidyltransferase family protein [Chitinispirillaceae bacterium]